MNILKEKRLAKNMTLEDVGNFVGVGKSTVRKWENGMIENMGRDKIVSISKALDISPLDILGMTETDFPQSTIETIYNKLNPPRQQKVYSFAEHQLEEQNSKIVNLDDYRTIELQSTVSAGTGVVDLEPNHSETIEYRGKLPKHYDMAFKVDGNSMEPMFKDGDIIFV